MLAIFLCVALREVLLIYFRHQMEKLYLSLVKHLRCRISYLLDKIHHSLFRMKNTRPYGANITSKHLFARMLDMLFYVPLSDWTS